MSKMQYALFDKAAAMPSDKNDKKHFLAWPRDFLISFFQNHDAKN